MSFDRKRTGISALAIALGTTIGAPGALSLELDGPVIVPDKGNAGIPPGQFFKIRPWDANFIKGQASFTKVQEAVFYKITVAPSDLDEPD